MTIADLFRSAREAEGLTQERVAHLAGASLSTIQRLEKGQPPNPRVLFTIARLLKIPADDVAAALESEPQPA